MSFKSDFDARWHDAQRPGLICDGISILILTAAWCAHGVLAGVLIICTFLSMIASAFVSDGGFGGY